MLPDTKVKCAEIYRNDGVYCFICYHCDEEHETSNSIINHIETHWTNGDANEDADTDTIPYQSLLTKIEIKCEENTFLAIFDENLEPTDVEYLNKPFQMAEEKEFSDVSSSDSEQSQYICGFCSESYRRKSLLENHIRIHQNEMTGSQAKCCSGCNSYFKTDKGLDNHLKQHQKFNHSTCNSCGVVFPHGCLFTLHFSTEHTNQETITCLICDLNYKEKLKLTKHMRYKHINPDLDCDECDSKFRSITNLKHHKLNHTGYMPFSCKVCDKRFPLKYPLKHHMQVHHKLYACLTCSETFRTNKLLTEHMKMHAIQKPAAGQRHVFQKSADEKQPRSLFRCDYCDTQFSAKKTLEHHLEKNNSYNPSELICVNCDGQFESGCQYVCHFTNKHTDLLTCLICDRQFSKMERLTVHMQRVHISTVQFKCNECDATFRQLCNLQQHQRTHTGERPYKCSICGKSFPLNSTLKLHMRFHLDERPYQCTVCGKMFHSAGLLTEHMKNHTKVRSHKCGQCYRSFMTAKTLLEHEERHKNSSVECPVCQKVLRSRKNFSQHMLLHRTGPKRYKCRFCAAEFSQAPGRRGHERKVHSV